MDAGLETALVMRCPGTLEGGQVNGHLLCNIDLMPTLLEFAGAEAPQDIDGVSFYRLLQNADGPSTRDHFFAELTWHDQYHPMRGVRTDRYKYIRNFEDGPSVYLPLDIHLSPSGHEVREEYYKPNVPEELYDLAKDPLEERNLADDPAYAEILLELQRKVEDWMVSGADRLLSGKVPGIAASDWQEQYDNGSAYGSKRG